MKKLVFFILIFSAFSFLAVAQKSKVISVFQLIETAKYSEAKQAIEESITDNKLSLWPRTWYARGLLCQTAYQKGIAENDKKKYELYPDQLYVAIESYEKALALDTRGRLNSQLEPLYVLLANDFQKLGEKNFQSKNYGEALRAFEQAIQIIDSPILSVKKDTNLVYNTALAAFETKEWDKAIKYLNKLNEGYYSPNASHLLFNAYLQKKDTLDAENALFDGIDRYEENEDLVLLLVDLLLQKNDIERAVAVLDSASAESPSNYMYPYTKGLVYQKSENYQDAIEAYEEAARLAPDEVKISKNIGTCYYNIGVEIDENARSIAVKSSYLAEKERSREAFTSAVDYFEKVLKKDGDDEETVETLYQLYKVLGMRDNIKSIEKKLK